MYSTVRNQLLQNVIQYYRIHHTDFEEIKSLLVFNTGYQSQYLTD